MTKRSEQEPPEWTAEDEAAHQRWLRRAYPQRVQALQAAPPAHGWR